MLLLVAGMILGCGSAAGQQILTLEDCRAKALAGNHSIQRAEERMSETEYLRKAALWQMLPRVSANGGYTWTQKSVNLLSKEQEERLYNMGYTVRDGLNSALREDLSSLPIGGELISQQLARIINSSSLTSSLNSVGNDIVQAMDIDTRNIGVGTVTLSQPLYTGGKLLSIYRTAALVSRMSGIEYERQCEETLIAVDEAYWQVVSVRQKKELAEQYVSLLTRLNSDVEEMVAAEVATRGDLAKVRVKLNEAQMNLTKATNGLALAKMLLAQRCGMELTADYEVVTPESFADSSNAADTIDMSSVLKNRKELQMLRIGDSMAREGVRLAAATLKPNVAVTGGYLFSNPNLFDGFKNEFGGTPMASVAVNIPICHPAAIYTLKAAKARQREAEHQRKEAEELIELQVNKANCELQLAGKKLDQALSNVDQAEENLKLATESFTAGACSSSDLMGAQTAWMAAKSDELDARIEITMMKVYLKQALGEK